jgi:hypothetical protein
MTSTTEQIEDWESFEEIRATNRFNMFDPAARIATGLTREQFLFCMANYDALKAAYEAA